MAVVIVPVVVSVAVGLAIVVVVVAVCVYRRRKKDERYRQYSQVAKSAIQPPPFSVRTEKQIVNEGLKGYPSRDTLGVRGMFSASEESLSPAISSDEVYYDALDPSDGGRRSPSISSRDLSPASAEEEEEEEMYPDKHIGRLWFNLHYKREQESLTLSLVKARNLPSRSKTVKTCDPFVKIALLPKDKHVAQSRYKRKTRRPTFNETYHIHIPEVDLETSTLHFTVFDGYRVNQQAIVGEVMYSLNEMEDLSGLVEVWRDLEKPIETSSERGDIHISLSYYPTLDRLTIIILRATNLRKMSHRGTDPFCKIAFSIGNKIMKTKKTAVHPDTMNPLFNDAFNFTVTEDDLATSTLLISVWHSGGGVREDKLIGRLLLGGRMYARGKECEHWTEMMTNPRKMIKLWHPLGA